MKEETASTEFAPADRSQESEIKRQTRLFANLPDFKRYIDFEPDVVVVLNENRQIVFANNTALQLLEAKDLSDVSGLRPGEALHCEHASASKGGCGTTAFCKYCGAVRAILSSLKGEEDVQECRITQETSGDAFDFLAYGFPFELGGEGFSVFILKDISEQKRKHILERIFLHDIMNILTGLSGFTQLLSQAKTGDEVREISDVLSGLSDRLIDEVMAQAELIKAEKHELAVNVSSIDSIELLNEIKDFYKKHGVAKGRDIVIDPAVQQIEFTSDKALVKRVLGNMIKNALEAIESGEVVKIGCTKMGDEIQFGVHNSGFMPDEVQRQIFKRSFSTKGEDRGLGTYSVRLLTERYLKGSVSFTTSQEDGTTFVARYPLTLN